MKLYTFFLSIVLTVFASTNVFADTTFVGPFSTNQTGHIIDKNNQAVSLHGVSWFGFNTSNHVLHGLWSQDFDAMLKQMKSLGFNAVRIPIQFDFVLDETIPPSSISTNCGSSLCNKDVPTDSAWHTLKWVVDQFTQNGFFVLIDDHYEDLTYENHYADWLTAWKKVATQFKDNPMVGYDLLNEPDSHGIRWDDVTGAPALGASYLEVIHAIYAIDPFKLIFIEGTGQGTLESNWGNGFATDDQTVQQGISNPKQFFTQLLVDPSAKQIVISPHIYGPDGTNGDGYDESNKDHAFKMWSRLVGYLNNNFLNVNGSAKNGFCLANGICHVFPIAVGEFGGKFDKTDPWYQQDNATNLNIAEFLVQLSGQGVESDANWFYWDWNPDSGNTGGILNNDWATIDCNKVHFLEENLGLKPTTTICNQS